MKASERSIAYQSAFHVVLVFDFQAPTAYHYRATSARLLPLPLPHLSMLKRPAAARGSLSCMHPGTLLLRNSIEQEPSDSPPHYFWDKPLARPLWQIGNLAASHNLSFSFTRGTGSFASRPSRHQLSVARFAKLFYSWRPQNVWGEKPVHATRHATSRAF